MERLDMRVWGRVQGVAFRWHARTTARGLGLTGRVRNLADGSVRLQAEGPRAALEGLRRWAVGGPDRARVDGHEETWTAASGQWSEFHIDG